MWEGTIKDVIKKGIGFLEKSQQGRGDFLSLTFQDKNNFKKAERKNSVFASALILECLNSLDDSCFGSSKIKKNIVNFLLGERSDDWTFNYWKRNSQESKETPYPDDLDDTLCVLSALYNFDSQLISGEVLAASIGLLTLMEKKAGGPYETWIVPEKARSKWQEIDLAVNSNAAYFLHLQGIFLENMDRLVEREMRRGKISSKYYYSQAPIFYFISRFYRGKNLEEIKKIIFKNLKKESLEKDFLQMALMISALLNFGYPYKNLEKEIKIILKGIHLQGFWVATPLIIEKIKNGQEMYSGSQELTTAFCLEALAKYVKAKEEGKEIEKQKEMNSEAEKICKEAIWKFKVMKKECFSNIQENDFELQNLIKKENGRQVILLPYYFEKSLEIDGKRMPRKKIIELGLANFLGWVAYTIYDDFLDLEGDIKKLPLANFCSRELTDIFLNVLPGNDEFIEFFKKVMNRIEKANLNEIKNWRMEFKQGKLIVPDQFAKANSDDFWAERSLGHALGPIAVLFFYGEGNDSKEVRLTYNFFKHYILARQLNDDVHDWKEDLARGQVTQVTRDILKCWQGKNKFKSLEIEKWDKKLEEIFWNDVVGVFCRKILFHTKKARKAYLNMDSIREKDFFEETILPMEKMAKKTLREQKDILELLKIYQRK